MHIVCIHLCKQHPDQDLEHSSTLQGFLWLLPVNIYPHSKLITVLPSVKQEKLVGKKSQQCTQKGENLIPEKSEDRNRGLTDSSRIMTLKQCQGISLHILLPPPGCYFLTNYLAHSSLSIASSQGPLQKAFSIPSGAENHIYYMLQSSLHSAVSES